MEKILAIIKRPDEKIGAIREIENKLEAFQEIVGGYIKTVTFPGPVVVICDEEGRIKGYPENCRVKDYSFVGPIMVVGTDGEDFTDCPINLFEWELMMEE